MKLNIELQGDVTIASLVGKLNGRTFARYERELESIIVPDCKIIFDVSECEYISNSGIRALATIMKRIRFIKDENGNDAKGEAIILGMTDEAKKVINATGFSEMLDYCDTFAESIDYMRKKEL